MIDTTEDKLTAEEQAQLDALSARDAAIKLAKANAAQATLKSTVSSAEFKTVLAGLTAALEGMPTASDNELSYVVNVMGRLADRFPTV